MSLLLEPGDRLVDKYVVEGLLGEGGMGRVYAARDEQLHRRVAIKVLHESYATDAKGRELALREARAVAGLRSEHVARVLDAGVAEGDQPFIVMDYLQGENLRARIAAGPLPMADAVGFIVQACEAIAEAHAAGIAHRDLKPDNLFVTKGVDGLPQIKVLDFGIARGTANDSDYSSGERVFRYIGSPPYLAPERLREPGAIDKRSDLWALGVVLYEALAGQRPFDDEDVAELATAILERKAQPLRSLRPEIPAALERIVDECLHKDPQSRIQSAGRLAERLLTFAAPWALPAGYRTMHMESHSNTERAVVVAERVAALSGVGTSGESASSATRAIVPRRLIVIRRNRSLALGAAAGAVVVAVLVAVIFLFVGRHGETGSVAPQQSATVTAPEIQPQPIRADAAPVEPMNPSATTQIETPSKPVKAPVRSGPRATAVRPVVRVDPLEGRK